MTISFTASSHSPSLCFVFLIFKCVALKKKPKKQNKPNPKKPTTQQIKQQTQQPTLH